MGVPWAHRRAGSNTLEQDGALSSRGEDPVSPQNKLLSPQGCCRMGPPARSPLGLGVPGRAVPGLAGELQPVSGGTSQSALCAAGGISREAFREMSRSWDPAKAQPRWALPGVLWQLLLGEEGNGDGAGMGWGENGNGDGMGWGRGWNRNGAGMGTGSGTRLRPPHAACRSGETETPFPPPKPFSVLQKPQTQVFFLPARHHPVGTDSSRVLLAPRPAAPPSNRSQREIFFLPASV